MLEWMNLRDKDNAPALKAYVVQTDFLKCLAQKLASQFNGMLRSLVQGDAVEPNDAKDFFRGLDYCNHVSTLAEEPAVAAALKQAVLAELIEAHVVPAVRAEDTGLAATILLRTTLNWAAHVVSTQPPSHATLRQRTLPLVHGRQSGLLVCTCRKSRRKIRRRPIFGWRRNPNASRYWRHTRRYSRR